MSEQACRLLNRTGGLPRCLRLYNPDAAFDTRSAQQRLPCRQSAAPEGAPLIENGPPS